jgi:hypothetical protein
MFLVSLAKYFRNILGRNAADMKTKSYFMSNIFFEQNFEVIKIKAANTP